MSAKKNIFNNDWEQFVAVQESVKQAIAPYFATQKSLRQAILPLLEAQQMAQQAMTSNMAGQNISSQAMNQFIATQNSLKQAINPYLAVNQSLNQVITPLLKAQEKMTQALMPYVATRQMVEQQLVPIKQIAETLASSYDYTKDMALKVAGGLGHLASTITQIQRTIESSPVWQAAREMRQAIEEKHIFKKSIIERWDALERELKFENRYFPKSEFLSIFDECTQQAGVTIKKGRTLYRARKIDEADIANDLKNAIYSVRNSLDKSFAHKMTGNANIWEYIEKMPYDEWADEFVYLFNLQNLKFWGFSVEKSDAPPNEYAQKPGRVNPPGIAYLYVATGFKTAMAEIQPMNGELISIATIKTKKRLRLFSFEFYESLKDNKLYNAPIVDFMELTGKSYWELETFFDTISELFSRPALGNSDNYYATQYLSEYIKSKGFDGIKFKSSLKKGGSNIVLFDTSKDESGEPINYEIVESHLHLVKNVTIKSNMIFPKVKSQKQNSD